jgi:ribosomal protein S27E
MNNIEKVILPSNGLLEGIPKEVTVRGMKGREISTLFSSLTDAAIEAIISNVVTEDLNIDLLPDQDKLFILHRTRILTFGTEVEQAVRCPQCGKIHNYVINYDDLELHLLEEADLTSEITLGTGDIISKRVPNKRVWDEINTYKDKIKIDPGMSYALLKAAMIEKINGKKKSISEIIEFLDNLPGNEFVKLTNQLEFKFGLDTTFEIECESCGSTFTGGLGINADLFREPDKNL